MLLENSYHSLLKMICYVIDYVIMTSSVRENDFISTLALRIDFFLVRVVGVNASITEFALATVRLDLSRVSVLTTLLSDFDFENLSVFLGKGRV